MEPRESRLLKNIERLTKRKITLLSVPTATDVHAKRLDLTRSSIHEILVNESDLGKYRSVVENLADEFDILDVAAAAMKFANEANWKDVSEIELPDDLSWKKAPREDRRDRGERGERTRKERGPRELSQGMVRLFIGAGRDAGVRPQDLVGAIANEAGIPSKLIGSIDIADRFSLVEVDENVAQDVIYALRDAFIKGRQCVVRYDREGSPKSYPSKKEGKDSEKPSRKGKGNKKAYK